MTTDEQTILEQNSKSRMRHAKLALMQEVDIMNAAIQLSSTVRPVRIGSL